MLRTVAVSRRCPVPASAAIRDRCLDRRRSRENVAPNFNGIEHSSILMFILCSMHFNARNPFDLTQGIIDLRRDDEPHQALFTCQRLSIDLVAQDNGLGCSFGEKLAGRARVPKLSAQITSTCAHVISDGICAVTRSSSRTPLNVKGPDVPWPVEMMYASETWVSG